MPDAKQALDQAIAASSIVRNGNTVIPGSGHWGVVAVQVPWAEWMALVDAVTKDDER